MTRIVGIRFKRAGRIYYFDPNELPLEMDEMVVVETSKGTEMGRVVISPSDVAESEVTEPLKPVMRKSTREDMDRMHSSRAREAEACTIGKCVSVIFYPADDPGRVAGCHREWRHILQDY